MGLLQLFPEFWGKCSVASYRREDTIILMHFNRSQRCIPAMRHLDGVHAVLVQHEARVLQLHQRRTASDGLWRCGDCWSSINRTSHVEGTRRVYTLFPHPPVLDRLLPRRYLIRLQLRYVVGGWFLFIGVMSNKISTWTYGLLVISPCA